jgi:hypothetical protein
MATHEDLLAYVGRLMGISRAQASELTGLANDAVSEVLDSEHIIDQSPDRDAVLETEEDEVDLEGIAARLHVQADELSTWVEDEMIFIAYGRNLAEGVAAEGPTALSATANFYCRWYNEVILKHGSVLLSDERQHRYNERGEE